MSTNARIGLKRNDGSIVSVYHHWDGYPEWLGKKLVEKYDNKFDIGYLISGGDISCIDSDKDWDHNDVPNHVQYYSLRGEKCPPQDHNNLSDYLDSMDNCGAEFAYIFMEKTGWVCFNQDQDVVPM